MHAVASSHYGRVRGRGFGVVLVVSSLVVVAAVTVAPAGPATAVTAGVQQPGIAITGITGRGESWLGAMQAPNGYGDDVTFCIMVGGDDPVGTTPAGEGMVGDPVLAAVMALHRWDDSPYARAAIGYLTHVRWEEGANGVSAQERKRRYEQYTPQVVKDTANHFLVEAAGFAGPYAAATVGASGSGARAGDVHGIGVTNGSGGWMGGLPFTATLSGPATFDATGSAAYSGRTASSPLALAWTATGTGQVAFRVTYGEVPRVTLTLVTGRRRTPRRSPRRPCRSRPSAGSSPSPRRRSPRTSSRRVSRSSTC
jgi:hypothetical protein